MTRYRPGRAFRRAAHYLIRFHNPRKRAKALAKMRRLELRGNGRADERHHARVTR